MKKGLIFLGLCLILLPILTECQRGGGGGGSGGSSGGSSGGGGGSYYGGDSEIGYGKDLSGKAFAAIFVSMVLCMPVTYFCCVVWIKCCCDREEEERENEADLKKPKQNYTSQD